MTVGTYYTDAETDVYDLVAELTEAHHPELHACGATVLCQMHHARGPLKLHGYPCYATAKVVPARDRAAGLRDARITIDAREWEGLDDGRRRAVLDHELRHFEPVGQWVFGEEDDPDRPGGRRETRTFSHVEDDAGRPRLRMRLHDVQMGLFRDVAERHGAASIEAELARVLADDRGQLLFPWDPDAAGGLTDVERAARKAMRGEKARDRARRRAAATA